jgi:hypothetical protein
MQMLKQFAPLAAIFSLCTSSFAQEGADAPQGVVVSNGDITAPAINRPYRLEDIARDNTPVYGQHLRGLNAPESDAIAHLFSSPPARLFEALSRQDSLLFSAARVAFLSSPAQLRQTSETICRRAIAVKSGAYNTGDVLSLGQELALLQETEQQANVGAYRAMLKSLTGEGAELMEKEKVEIHSHLASFETDFVKQSESEPEWFLNQLVANCDPKQ